MGRIAKALFSPWATVGMALLVVVIVVFPWDVAKPRLYQGFDPQLMFVDEDGYSPRPGVVRLDRERATFVARGGSQPTLHPVTTTNAFSSEFDVVVPSVPSGNGWREIRAVVEAPPGARYATVLVGAANGTVLFDDIKVTAVADGGGLVVFAENFADQALPQWVLGDGASLAPEGTRGNGNALRIAAPGRKERGAWTTYIEPLPEGARQYVVRARVRHETGFAPFKLAVDWLDKDGQHLAYAPDWPDWAPYLLPSVPLRVRLWHPSAGNAIEVQFAQDGGARIVGSVSEGGTVVSGRFLGTYEPGASYHVRVDWEPGERAAFRIRGPDGRTIVYKANKESGFDVLQSPIINLSLDSSAPLGSQVQAEVTDFQLSIAAKTRLFAYMSDWRAMALTATVVVWMAGCAAHYLGPRLVRRPREEGPAVRGWVSNRRTLLLAAAAVLGSCGLYAAVGFIDGHPFDRLSQESWMYVIQQYGLDDLYARTSVVPDGAVRGGGAPWSTAEIAYPLGSGYFYLVVGKAWGLLSGPIDPLGDQALHAFWKAGFSVAMAVLGVAVFFVLRRTLGLSVRWALLGAGAYALNPAVIFDSAVWGQSDTLLTGLLLFAALAFVVDRPKAGWSLLAISLFVKPTAFLAVPILGLVSIRRYGLARTMEYGAFGAVVVFVLLSPFIFAGYHPATFYLPTVGKLFDFASPVPVFSSSLSADTFPVWSIFTGLQGLSGLERIAASDADPLPVLGISYLTASHVLMALTYAVSAVLIWRTRSREAWPRLLFLLLALVFLAYVTFGTRTSGRYATLVLPFLILGLCLPGSLRWLWAVGAVSLVSFLSQYGLFMHIAERDEWPSFLGLGNPSTNAVSSAVYWVYTSDVFITAFALMLLLSTAIVFWQVIKLGGWTRRLAVLGGGPESRGPHPGRARQEHRNG